MGRNWAEAGVLPSILQRLHATWRGNECAANHCQGRCGQIKSINDHFYFTGSCTSLYERAATSLSLINGMVKTSSHFSRASLVLFLWPWKENKFTWTIMSLGNGAAGMHAAQRRRKSQQIGPSICSEILINEPFQDLAEPNDLREEFPEKYQEMLSECPKLVSKSRGEFLPLVSLTSKIQ